MMLFACCVSTFEMLASFTLFNGTVIQLSAVGGVRVEYANILVLFPTTTHVPFPNMIPFVAPPPKIVGENEVGIPTHDSAVGGLANEYAIQFDPSPTATHAPFP